MSVPYNIVSLRKPRLTKRRVEFPFTSFGDRKTFVITETWSVWHDQIDRVAKPLDEPHYEPRYSSAILTEDMMGLAIGDDGMATWQREYAMVPQSHVKSVPGAFVFPGMVGSIYNNSHTISSVNASNQITTATTHSFNVGDVVIIIGQKTYTAGRQSWYVVDGKRTKTKIYPFQARLKVTAVTSNTVTFATPITGVFVLIGVSVTTTLYTVRDYISSRLPKAWSGIATSRNSFVLTTNPANEVQSVEKFSIVTSAGEETDTVTSSTNPSLSDYLGYLGNRSEIQIETSRVSRWKGNIWQIEDITAEAR